MKHAFLVAMVTFFVAVIFLLFIGAGVSIYVFENWFLIILACAAFFAVMAFFISLLNQEDDKKRA